MATPIAKEQWEKWADQYASTSADDFAKHVPLNIEQLIILKAKLEAAALYGMAVAAATHEAGGDLSTARDAKPALSRLRAGDTYDLKIESDGTNAAVVHPKAE